MEVVYIIGAAQAFFLPFLILNKKSKSFADYVLTAWFVLIGLALLAYYLEVRGAAAEYPVFLGFSTCFALLLGPISYIYVLAITNLERTFRPAMALHALPYLFFTTVVFIKLFVFAGSSVEADRLMIEDPEAPVFVVMGLFRIFLGPVYLVACLLILRKHSRRIRNEFSYIADVDLSWLRKVILSLLVIWLTVVLVNIAGNFNDWVPIEWGDHLIHLTVTAAVFFVGFYGIRQQVIFSPVEPDRGRDSEGAESKAPGHYRKSSLTAEKSRALLNQLLHHMEQEEPYLDGKISLHDLAGRLGISANHLSQVINENLGKSFYDFINEYRVAMVKHKLAESGYRRANLLSIAHDCGFNSKSSFNEVFKKHTGLTPSQYRKQLES